MSRWRRLARKSVCQNFGHQHDELIFLNAEVRKGQFFLCDLWENLCVLCGKMSLIIHDYLRRRTGSL